MPSLGRLVPVAGWVLSSWALMPGTSSLLHPAPSAGQARKEKPGGQISAIPLQNHGGKTSPLPTGSSRERVPREMHGGSFPGCCGASLAPKRCADTAIMLLGKGLNHPPPSPKTTPGLVVPILPALHSTRPGQGCYWVLLCLEPDGVFPRIWEEWESVEAG